MAWQRQNSLPSFILSKPSLFTLPFGCLMFFLSLLWTYFTSLFFPTALSVSADEAGTLSVESWRCRTTQYAPSYSTSAPALLWRPLWGMLALNGWCHWLFVSMHIQPGKCRATGQMKQCWDRRLSGQDDGWMSGDTLKVDWVNGFKIRQDEVQ